MSAAEADRPDDPRRRSEGDPMPVGGDPVSPDDFTLRRIGGPPVRHVIKTRARIRANRDLIMHVFECPDDFVEEMVRYVLGRIPPR